MLSELARSKLVPGSKLVVAEVQTYNAYYKILVIKAKLAQGINAVGSEATG